MISVLDHANMLQRFINSPPGQLAAGGVLAGITWKFFERVEAVLTKDTKLEIALWLVGVKTSERLSHWPVNFASMFDQVFGQQHLSWKCFLRSCVASYASSLIGLSIWFSVQAFHQRPNGDLSSILIISTVGALGTFIPDYLSLLKARFLISRMKNFPRRTLVNIGILMVDVGTTTLIGLGTLIALLKTIGMQMFYFPSNTWHSGLPALVRDSLVGEPGVVWFYPAFFTSVWLWLYAGAGFLLRTATQFDIGAGWFTSKFDIEDKPLQSIGLIAGSLVAVLYWTFAAAVYLLSK